MKKYYYLNDKNLKEGYPCVVKSSDTPLENYELYFLQRELAVREYYGDANIPERVVWDENLKIVREATEQEKYEINPSLYKLQSDRYYIKDDQVKEYPTGKEGMLKPIFNIELEIWEENATEIEIENYQNSMYRDFYYQELNDFNKATMEYNAGILTVEEYSECQEYIRFLNSQLNINPKQEAKKPLQMSY